MRRIRPTRPARGELPLTHSDAAELAAMHDNAAWTLRTVLVGYPDWPERGMREAGQ